MIINRTEVVLGCIQDAIEESINFFLRTYPYDLTCRYNIILCDGFENLENEWRKYYNYDTSQTLPLHFDGQFLAPETRSDELTILICLKKTVIAGAEQYFREKTSGREEPSEERGLKLLAFFHFVELLCHEFSHLCSYDRMMTRTSWADPMLPAHSHDYHLHDEFIARIRGTEVMLRMGASIMEPDLIYSLYMGCVNDTKTQFMERTAEVREFVEKARHDLEAALPEMQRRQNLTDEEMVEGLEYELGHELQYGRVDGRIKLSDLEVMEFSAVDEMAEMMKEKQEFTFTYEGNDKDLLTYSFTFVNEPTTVELSKTDITTGKELPGTHLRVIDQNAVLIDEWVSTETPHIIQKLVVGREYELIETKPADVYVTAEPVTFKIENTGEVQKVKMEDDVTKAYLSKSDITDGKPVIGAKLSIIDETGKVVETWTTTEEEHYIEKLPVGDYTLREVTAPDGYDVAEDVKFTVKATGEIQTVIIRRMDIRS